MAETPAQYPSNHHVGYVAGAVAGTGDVAYGIDADGFSIPGESVVAADDIDGVVFYRFGMLAANRVDDEGSARLDGLLPFAYAQLLTDLPWPAWRTPVQSNALGGQRDALVDATVLLGWASASVTFESGYRRYLLKLANSNPLDRRAVDLSGPYATLSLRF